MLSGDLHDGLGFLTRGSLTRQFPTSLDFFPDSSEILLRFFWKGGFSGILEVDVGIRGYFGMFLGRFQHHFFLFGALSDIQ